MADPVRPSVLVTTLRIRSYGGVSLERFEVPDVFRPMYTNPDQLYSVETHPEDATIRDILRSSPVDIATWLHRAGVWDHMPVEP